MNISHATAQLPIKDPSIFRPYQLESQVPEMPGKARPGPLNPRTVDPLRHWKIAIGPADIRKYEIGPHRSKNSKSY